ncbi:hypothetical protein DFH09DRAFT_1158560, partial [Mycena vulgaris]
MDIDTILAVCAGGSKRLRLIHYTTQKYLDRIQAHTFPRAQTEITMTCITYLSFEIFSKDIPDPIHLFRRNSLLDYAVECCLLHARGQPEFHIRDAIMSVLADDSAWRKLWDWKHSHAGGRRRKPAPRLWIAAVFHLEEICRGLIKEDSVGPAIKEASLSGLTGVARFLLQNGSMNMSGGDYGKALLAAAFHGH